MTNLKKIKTVYPYYSTDQLISTSGFEPLLKLIKLLFREKPHNHMLSTILT